MCKHPLKAWKIGLTESGKDLLKITSFKVNHIEKNSITHNWQCCEDSFESPFAEKVIRKYIEIPCGSCIDCKLQYSREWADRCMLEMKYHNKDECWFITLTYDDEHIKKYDYGHDIFPGTLCKSDFQDFMKRLRDHVNRDYNGKKIRFYACGEYGSTTYRPHYHAIIYSLPLQDVKLFCVSKKGYPLYQSDYVDNIWKNGYVMIGKVTWDTCAYTARYVLKKATGVKPDDYVSQGLAPEFVLMSRKPGIGGLYFDDHYKEIYKSDEIYFSQDDGGRKSKPPKYFDRRLEVLDPVHYNEIKNNRKEKAEFTKKLKLAKTDLDYEELLEVEENVLKRRIKGLPRNVF